MTDIIDFIKFLFILFVGFILLVSFAMGITTVYSSYTCGKYEEATGVTTKYIGFTCYINTENGFMAYEEYKARNYINHSERSN